MYYVARLAAILFALLLCGFFWQAPSWEKINRDIDTAFPSVQSISTESLKSLLVQKRDITVIDVREDKEFQVSHLPRAINLQSPDDVHLEKDRSIVVYCSVGIRSGDFADKLQRRGYRDVKNLRGSIFEWANRGYPLLQGKTTATTVHPYNKKWGQLLRPELRYPLD